MELGPRAESSTKQCPAVAQQESVNALRDGVYSLTRFHRMYSDLCLVTNSGCLLSTSRFSPVEATHSSLQMQERERLRLVSTHPGKRDSMNAWGTAPCGSALWSTDRQSSTPAWPPYNLPSDYLPSSSVSLQQTHHAPDSARPSGQVSHGPVPQMPAQSTPQQGTPSNSGAVMQVALTTVPQHPTSITYQPPYNVHNQPHCGLPLESYYTAHLQYPKTWVHLWDRLPLREPETLISSVRAWSAWAESAMMEQLCHVFLAT